MCRLNFAQRSIFSGSGKNPSTSAGFEPANLGSLGDHVTPRPPRPTSIQFMNMPFSHIVPYAILSIFLMNFINLINQVITLLSVSVYDKVVIIWLYKKDGSRNLPKRIFECGSSSAPQLISESCPPQGALSTHYHQISPSSSFLFRTYFHPFHPPLCSLRLFLPPSGYERKIFLLIS